MHGDHLALEMGRELADRDADIGELALDLVAVSLALMGLVEIEEAPVPAGDLDRLVAIALGPARDAFERVVRGCVLRELGKKQPWPFHRPHAASSLRVQDPRWFEQGSAGGLRLVCQISRHVSTDAGRRELRLTLLDDFHK